MADFPVFMTIRETVATGLISEVRLRKMVKEEMCPGLHVGNRFVVNVTALAEQLDIESRNNVKNRKMVK